MTKLRIVLLAQAAVFAVWGAWLLGSRYSGSPEFYLETAPVDPRDLISGTYVALSYPASLPEAPGCGELLEREPRVYVQFSDSGRSAPGPAGPVRLYTPTACSARAAAGWARAEARFGPGGRRLEYGIEKFFLNEDDPRKNARSGEVLAKVKTGADGRLMLLDLVELPRPAAPEAAPAGTGTGN